MHAFPKKSYKLIYSLTESNIMDEVEETLMNLSLLARNGECFLIIIDCLKSTLSSVIELVLWEKSEKLEKILVRLLDQLCKVCYFLYARFLYSTLY